MDKLKLFCFPYAGGSASVFNTWWQYMDPAIELVPVELAGRGKRIHEAFYEDLPALIDDAFRLIKEEIIRSPYALFGHSMGSKICYGLLQKIREIHLPEPVHIFFSGSNAPHIKRSDEKKYHLMTDEDFKKEVIKLGGTPPEIFDYPALSGVFIPLLKNDFKLVESETGNGAIVPVDIDITVFFGKDDDLTAGECDGWKRHTKRVCNIHYFEGGHFFLNDQKAKVIKIINYTLHQLQINYY